MSKIRLLTTGSKKASLSAQKELTFICLQSRFVFWFWLQPATKAPRGRPSPSWGAEENAKKQAETGGSG